MNPQLLSRIKETPFFDGLEDDRLTRALSAFHAVRYQRGEIISGVADVDARTYVVVDGVARAVRVNSDGRCLTSGLLDAGMVFGRLPFVEETRTEQVEALADCDILVSSTRDLQTLAAVDPIVARNLARSNALRLRASEARLVGLAFQPVPARLAGVLTELADHFGKVTPEGVRIDIRLTHGSLAEMTGTTRETLTKVSGWLRSEDIASIERRLIWVLDWDALVAVEEGLRTMPGRTSKVVVEL
ncbi:MAG: Crp/Fnr family transcriptional regulator [Thermoleophilia bacterium]|nr:Crp/Fnr family transcriptional regulator [Thermoleophilia bacterium]